MPAIRITINTDKFFEGINNEEGSRKARQAVGKALQEVGKILETGEYVSRFANDCLSGDVDEL